MEQPHPGRYAGQIASMRAALLLMYAGVQDVRVLDGGLDSWIGAGYRLEADPVIPEPVESFGLKIPAHPEYVIDIEEAKEYLANPECELVCMRSWSEFIGEKSGYHYIGPRGRIPGAVFGNCGSDAYHMQNYRNLDNTMLDYHEIASNWREVGIVPEKKIAFYCGTGWRASEAFFYAYLLGWERIAIYDGGWYEWSIDAGNPVETGIPEGLFIKTRRY
ncbi:MAG: rhodanese-like domain-containing protein [Acidobacteriota bacterium]